MPRGTLPLLAALLSLSTVSSVLAEPDPGFDIRYERDSNIFHPINIFKPDNPFNPINRFNLDTPFRPLR